MKVYMNDDKTNLDPWPHNARTYVQLPLRQWGCRQCLPLSVVQLKGKQCRKPHCRNGVADMFGLYRVDFTGYPSNQFAGYRLNGQQLFPTIFCEYPLIFFYL